MRQRRPDADERQTAFLMVEIKVREFRAKLLLASRAARQGLRVYLGTRTAVMDALSSRAHRAGVYYFKGGEPAGAFRTVARHCEYVVGQDEEIGPALNPDDVVRAWKMRYDDEVEPLIDQVYVFSTPHRDLLRDARPVLGAKATVTGWPRVDLWQAPFRRADEARAADLRRRFGRFVLFPSNFKVNSEEQRRRRIAVARQVASERVVAGGRSPGDEDDYGSLGTHRYEAFRRAAALLRQVAERADGERIVVRAHPAEDPAGWREVLRGVPQVSVVADGEVGPWLLAAQGVMHAGCTTAVEAACYGVPCGYLEDVGYLPGNIGRTGSYRVSRPLRGIDDAVAFVRDAVAGRLEPPAVSELPEAAVGPVEGLASERIAAELVSLGATPEPPLAVDRAADMKRTGARVVASLRRVRSRMDSDPSFVGTNAQAKVPGGLHFDEARRILDELGQGEGLLVEEPRYNLLRIESVGTG